MEMQNCMFSMFFPLVTQTASCRLKLRRIITTTKSPFSFHALYPLPPIWPQLPLNPPPPLSDSSRLADVSGWLLPSWEQPADDSDLHRCLQCLSVLAAKPPQPAGLAESPTGQRPGTQRRGVGAHVLQIQLRCNPVDLIQNKVFFYSMAQ